MYMMIMKKVISETFRGTIFEKTMVAKECMTKIKKKFINNKKSRESYIRDKFSFNVVQKK